MSMGLAIAAATLSWGLWAFAYKQAVLRGHPLTLQWLLAIPYVASIPFYYWISRRASPGAALHTGAVVWSFVASACSITASYCFLVALQQGPAPWVTACISAYPLVALLLFVGAGQERLTLRTLVGVCLVVAGLMVMEIRTPER